MKKAFSLIELLIVVSIIGILAVIAVPNFLNAQVRAKIAHTQAQMKTIMNIVKMKEVDHRGGGLKGWGCDVYSSMTTPIAYLGGMEATIDIFADYTMDSEGVLLKTRQCYFLTKDRIAARLMNSAPTFLFSVGPDRQYSSPQMLFPLIDTPYAGVPKDNVYDVTNGVVSFGDIILVDYSTSAVFVEKDRLVSRP